MKLVVHQRMGPASIWMLLVLIIVVIPMSNSEEESVKQSLLQFIEKLSNGNPPKGPAWGWNNVSDPCNSTWKGVRCRSQRVYRIVLEELNFKGTLDATSVCTAKSLVFLSLRGNNISGSLPEEIGSCKSLTHLYISGNRFSGSIPASLSRLGNLKKLDLSNNNFSGQFPNLSRISGLLFFLVQNNQFSGAIPNLDFSNLQLFNVSNNNFSGPIPDVNGKFTTDSFLGNPELCGKPSTNACPPSAPPLPQPLAPSVSPLKKETKSSLKEQFVTFSGYIILLFFVMVLLALKLGSKKRKKPIKERSDANAAAIGASSKFTNTSSEFNTNRNRSEYSVTSAEGGKSSSSLVLLSNPVVKGLRFEDLLRASAELLGRGKHGSLFKVELDNGVVLAVKRIKDWDISCEDFERRISRIDQVRHPKVLSAGAFYCCKEEKLLVYEYQPSGSLFKHLHDSQSGQEFDWGSRLSVAANIAAALAFMHEELHQDEIAHGNLKSTNILFDRDMEPCISEYGLMVEERLDQSFLCQSYSFKRNALNGDQVYSTFMLDIYSFGAILLELLTGKFVLNNGFDLAKWVHTVVREEWTGEVFDRRLISEGANEERMLSLLRVALQCINPSPNERPSMNRVASMIHRIKEEEEKSISSSVR